MSDLANTDSFEVERTTHTNYTEETGETDTSRVITDGGSDIEVAADQEILDAVERHDDLDSPTAPVFVEVRDLLAAINSDTVEMWELHSDMLDDGAYEIVHEDRDTIILAGNTDNFWNEHLEAHDVDDVVGDIVTDIHHKVARDECDYSRSGSSPIVVRKPYTWQTGETHVLSEVARRTAKQGSTSRGLDQYAVKVHGFSQRLWASLTGRNESTVSRTVRSEE